MSTDALGVCHGCDVDGDRAVAVVHVATVNGAGAVTQRHLVVARLGHGCLRSGHTRAEDDNPR